MSFDSLNILEKIINRVVYDAEKRHEANSSHIKKGASRETLHVCTYSKNWTLHRWLTKHTKKHHKAAKVHCCCTTGPLILSLDDC
jgi:hypothetical protein